MAKSRRPYLIRAVYDWAADNGYTPHLLIAADAEGVTVPREYVKEGRITLNISPMAVQNLDLKRDPIQFFARFGGQPFNVQVPSGAVIAIFARENGEGHVFGEIEPTDPSGKSDTPQPPPPSGKPKLRVVK
ncbi:MAG TPA: ClpXP protease specificity-enhancing factor [Verrucomicrobiae bacterium]|nr:ClpXP protease specificity-enhancing factor [Verrucomicrobiae bacterium]